MKFKPGWLKRQLEHASKTVASWPKHKQENMTLEAEQCPVCGYYCTGKGGFGCIDKPSMLEKETK